MRSPPLQVSSLNLQVRLRLVRVPQPTCDIRLEVCPSRVCQDPARRLSFRLRIPFELQACGSMQPRSRKARKARLAFFGVLLVSCSIILSTAPA